MAKVRLVNNFKNCMIKIKSKKAIGTKCIKLDPAKYKPIRIIKKKGDWPEEMWISWNNGDFDLISLEKVQLKRNSENNRIYLTFKDSEFDPKEIVEFEIQIKIKGTPPNEGNQSNWSSNDQDTTVTIGEAKPTVPH